MPLCQTRVKYIPCTAYSYTSITHTAELLVYNHIHWYILSNIQLGLGNSMSVLVTHMQNNNASLMPPLATPSVCVCARTKSRLPQVLTLCLSQNRHFFHLFPPSPCFLCYNQQQSNTQHTTTHHRHAAGSLFCFLHKAAGRNHNHVPDSLITNLPQTRTRLTIYKSHSQASLASLVAFFFCFAVALPTQYWQRFVRQYLYFCTSKASKLRT
jgi:hypothetical protein